MTPILYIDWFNVGVHAVQDRTPLQDSFSAFLELGRLLILSAEVYEEAGGVLRQLQASHGYRLRHAYSLRQ